MPANTPLPTFPTDRLSWLLIDLGGAHPVLPLAHLEPDDMDGLMEELMNVAHGPERLALALREGLDVQAAFGVLMGLVAGIDSNAKNAGRHHEQGMVLAEHLIEAGGRASTLVCDGNALTHLSLCFHPEQPWPECWNGAVHLATCMGRGDPESLREGLEMVEDGHSALEFSLTTLGLPLARALLDLCRKANTEAAIDWPTALRILSDEAHDQMDPDFYEPSVFSREVDLLIDAMLEHGVTLDGEDGMLAHLNPDGVIFERVVVRSRQDLEQALPESNPSPRKGPVRL
jgi:hypothetical protein